MTSHVLLLIAPISSILLDPQILDARAHEAQSMVRVETDEQLGKLGQCDAFLLLELRKQNQTDRIRSQ